MGGIVLVIWIIIISFSLDTSLPPACLHFLKPFLKGKNLQSGEYIRGVKSILITILRF